MSTEPVAPKSEALAALYWRSEILQVMYWLRGEGFGDVVDPGLIERFLGVDAAIGMTYLDRLADEGYVVRDGDWFALSDFGLDYGAREFASSFAELTKPTHGECSDDCWCHASVDEAEACLAHRIQHNHTDDNHTDNNHTDHNHTDNNHTDHNHTAGPAHDHTEPDGPGGHDH